MYRNVVFSAFWVVVIVVALLAGIFGASFYVRYGLGPSDVSALNIKNTNVTPAMAQEAVDIAIDTFNDAALAYEEYVGQHGSDPAIEDHLELALNFLRQAQSALQAQDWRNAFIFARRSTSQSRIALKLMGQPPIATVTPAVTPVPAPSFTPQTSTTDCQPRPACLNLPNPCDIAEPASGWCPSGTPTPTASPTPTPTPTCHTPPKCVYDDPPCPYLGPPIPWCSP